MKQALIDIGSNSIRLTVYELNGDVFTTLFKEKIMAGLAGYVENGILSSEGIECACNSLLQFKETVNLLEIDAVAVFATASLRNIENTEEALAAIKSATGYAVDLITGEEEALYGYLGAMRELSFHHGSFVDIGGASTEIAVFSQESGPRSLMSFPIGSLSLYRECVKKIMPGDGSLKKMQKMIASKVEGKKILSFEKQSPMICVGGTSRAVLKIAKKQYDLPTNCHTITAVQLHKICAFLRKADKAASDLVLKLEPDRIHTIVPGVMILNHISKLFDADEIVVSKYGVREGYLCQKILQPGTNSISIPKIEN